MEHEQMIDKINTALNILEGVRLALLKEQKPEKKKKPAADPVKDSKKDLADMGELNRQLTIKQILEKYGQPADDDHVESIYKIVNKNGITIKELDSCIERVKTANDKEPKNDIKKYTYSCLYKEGKE